MTMQPEKLILERVILQSVSFAILLFTMPLRDKAQMDIEILISMASYRGSRE